MKVLVLGLGSMGKRRIRLMQRAFPEIDIAGIDTSAERRKEAEALFRIPLFGSLGEALAQSRFDAAFVCTAPLSHSELIFACLESGLDVFSEINLVADGYERNIEKAREKNKILFLSSTPMYRKEIQFISSKINEHTGLCYHYHVGQYLPDWHPWESFQAFFVGEKRTNGCRELFAIELPWLINAFGAVEKMHVLRANHSSLALDYPDSFIVSLEHQNKTQGVLMIDVVSRSAIRSLEIVGEELHLFWQGTPESLRVLNLACGQFETIELYEKVEHNSQYAANIVENAYLDEIEAFFHCLEGGAQPRHSFEKDRQILQLIDQIEN